jgi:NADH-quinone oxidoreductase subunit D
MPEGNEFHADVPDYYPPEEDVYTSMESLIYHFKIVMGEILFQLQKYTIL